MQATIFVESVSDACGADTVEKVCTRGYTDDNQAGNMTWPHFEDLAIAINMVRPHPIVSLPMCQLLK